MLENEFCFGVAVVRRESLRGSISIYEISFLLQSRTEDVRIHSCVSLNIYCCCSLKERRELILHTFRRLLQQLNCFNK